MSAPGKPPKAPDLDILGDRVTIHPSGYTESQSQDGNLQERNLVEHMARFRDAPLEFLREISLHVTGRGWRSYDEPIGQPIFYPGFTDNMKAMVLSTPGLQRKINDLTERRLEVEQQHGLLESQDGTYISKRAQRKDVIEQSLHEVADKLTDGMICKFESKNFIRGAYYLCTQLLTRAYHQGAHRSLSSFNQLQLINSDDPCS